MTATTVWPKQGDPLQLEEEGGITEISLNNARALIAEFGKPERVEVFVDGQNEEMVEANWRWDNIDHLFSGFSWGYGGEGPNGLVTFFKMIGYECSIREVAGWPADMPALTLIQGEDY
jgi:hypothetical protein